MAGLMDLLLALVNVLCGGSKTRAQPPGEHEKPHAAPAPQETVSIPHVYPQEQQEKPAPYLRTDHRPHQDQNQINQHDGHYMALRAKANEEGDLMAQCFQQSHEAYGQGDGARAKQLSQQGKQHERKMESLNAEASAWIFRQNNLDSRPGEIDLHGLYVKEAISYVEQSVQEARRRGDTEIRLIVGRGLHSNGHVAKIKPAIEDFMMKQSIPTQVDPYNAGVLVAQLC